MRSNRTIPIRLTICVALIGLSSSHRLLHVHAAEPDATGTDTVARRTSLQRPDWRIGDSWIMETLTDRIQGSEARPAVKPAAVRWQFRVAKFEKVAGADCFRVDVECLAKGRLQPKSTFWCDRKTLFLRQFQTQFAFDGRYRTVQESYYCAKGQYAPVLASINVLPLALPAFVPQGAKVAGTFTYTSLPLPAGSKDPNIVRFAHAVRQEVLPPGAKSLDQIPRTYSKNLSSKPVAEVRLTDHRQTVTQLWQAGVPWPVYVNNGRTQAWLVSTVRPTR